MSEHTPKISTLVTHTVVSVEKRVVVEDIPELSISLIAYGCFYSNAFWVTKWSCVGVLTC